jgi:hypothetical protein
MITNRTDQLLTQFDARCSKPGAAPVPLDLYEWFGYYVFDIMTDLAWGGGGNAVLEGRDPDGAIASLRYSLHLAGMTKVLPWFARYLVRLPWVDAKTTEFRRFSSNMFLQRQASRGEGGQRDVFYHLLGEGTEDGPQLTVNALQADSRQVVT